MKDKMFKFFWVLIVSVLISFRVDAQIDTAYASNLYSNQYIFPPLMDTNYTSTNTMLQGFLALEGWS